MTSALQRIAVLGLGRMGAPIAANLARAGFDVRGWNRSPRPAARGLGIAPRASALEAVADVDVAILVLSDRAAIDAALFDSGAAAGLRAGAVVIDMGTTGPQAAGEHAARLRRYGVDYLDAPVSGGVAGAEAASLTIMTGGAAATFERVRPVLEALGRPHLLGSTGAGQTAKLANQMIVAGYIAAVAEGLRFAEAQGLDAARLIDALEGGFADSAILRRHGRKMAARDFTPGGACRLHLKDLRLAAALAPRGMAEFANTAEALRRFERLVATGFGDLDHSAYFQTYEAEP